jgi:membrane associated rhomboid family serine protease
LQRYRYNISSFVVVLVIVNVVVFFISRISYFPVPQRLLENLVNNGKAASAFSIKRYGLFMSLFSLFPVLIRELGWVWQFFTYMFLHGSLWHLFFNMYALFLFGRPLEDRWGTKEFLFFYISTGIGAGIVTYFWNMIGNPLIPTIGASGAVFGVMLAFGLEFPDTLLLLFFVIPLRAKYAALIFGGIELIMILTGAMRGIGHFTHLAGLLFGYIYYLLRIKKRYRRQTPLFSGRMKKFVAEKKRKAVDQRKDQLVQKALAIMKKLKTGDPLSHPEAQMLSKLKEAYNNHSGDICDADEFELTARDCNNCEDFYACVYRYIMNELHSV